MNDFEPGSKKGLDHLAAVLPAPPSTEEPKCPHFYDDCHHDKQGKPCYDGYQACPMLLGVKLRSPKLTPEELRSMLLSSNL